ncbi:hypothetical protein D6D01_07506 [Aureobasidium pullulans]|uniref:G domain-containing protein n=1 Tax=Aureobasidium pullulans TaxID=5580 RepID=A0A4S9KP15_AURPU|nr:hypothetical protein D6D01_07506 [Aureobasidium pullulans]
MGLTGSGKSSFISCLAEEAVAAIGTTEVTIYSFQHPDGRRIFLIDTPGFNDSNRSDTSVLKDTYADKVRLSGIVYLHSIKDTRMPGSSLRNLRMFQKLCGDDALGHIVLAPTMWDTQNGETSVSHQRCVEREKELMENQSWWGFMIDRGSRVVRHTQDRASALKILDMLLARKLKTVLDIQKELFDDKKNLDDTAAGQTLEKELNELKRKNREDLEEIQASYEAALRTQDLKLAEALREERERLDREMMAAGQAQQDLKIRFEKLAVEVTARYNQLLQETQNRETQMAARLERQQEAAKLEACAMEIKMQKAGSRTSKLKMTLAAFGVVAGAVKTGSGMADGNPGHMIDGVIEMANHFRD